MLFPDISSSKRRRSATSRARSAREKKEPTIWTSSFSVPSWTKLAPSDREVSVYTSLGNRFFIRESWKQSITSNERTDFILYFSRLMEHFLIDSSMTSFDLKLTRSSGPGVGITLVREQLNSSVKGVPSACSSKKPRKKSSSSGQSSQGSK